MVQKDICTPMFLTMLFTIAKTQNECKYPLTDEWVTMEYYLAIEMKKKTFLKRDYNNSTFRNMNGPKVYYTR